MKVDPGDGDANGGDGAYVKPYRGALPYPGLGDGAFAEDVRGWSTRKDARCPVGTP